MKRLVYLLLLAVMVGSVFADVMPERRLGRPLVNQPQVSVDRWSWLGAMDGVMPRFLVPLLWPAAPRLSAPKRLPVDPVPPPLCDVRCDLRPIQAIGQ